MNHPSRTRTFSPFRGHLLPAAAATCFALGLGVTTGLADTGAALVPGSQQDFEGGGLGFSLGGGFGSGGTTDYWEVIPNNGTRVNAATITTGGVFNNASPGGGSVLAGDDTNAGGTDPVTVTFNAVTVSGLTNLSANVLLAATNPAAGSPVTRGFEAPDFVEVQVSYNGGAFQQLAIFEPDTSFNTANSYLALNGSGTGTDAGSIEQGFKNFAFPLSVANTVAIRITVSAGATGEYVAIDNFRVCGDLAVTDPPVLAAIEGTAISYTEGAGAVQVTNSITVADNDSPTLTGGTVTISSNSTPSEDVLNATGTGSVTVSGNGTTSLTLSGSGTLAQYQQVLRSVTYTNTNILNPNTAQRTVSFQVTDDQSNGSNLQMRNINVANTVQTFGIPHTESFDDGAGTGDRYEVIGGFDLAADDFFSRIPASSAATRFAIPITGVQGGGFFGGEDIDQNGLADGGKVVVCLNAAGFGNLSVDVLLAAASTNPFEGSDGVWVEHQFDAGPWQELIAFRPGPGGVLSEDTDDNGVGDGTALTAALTNFNLPILDTGGLLKVRVRALNGTTGEEIAFDELTVNGVLVGASPVLANIDSGPVSYTEGDGAVQITANSTITDADDTDLTGATVAISGNYVNGEDVLAFPNAGGITGNFDAPSGILTLSGTATLAAYETALRTVTYENTNALAPSQNTRTVTFRVTDGLSNSNSMDTLVSVLDLVPAQPAPHCESFETDGLGTRYAANTFNLGANDLFDRAAADKDDLTGVNADGSFALVGEDTDGDGNPVHSVEIIVDTTGGTNLTLDLKLAANLNQFEPADNIRIEVEADGGGFNTLDTFAGTGINTNLTNGGATLVPDFQDFSYPLPDADEIRVRVSLNNSATTEEMAVDNICVDGDFKPQLSPLARNINEDQPVNFTAADFDAGFTDANPGDQLETLRITSLPGNGTLFLSGVGALGAAPVDVPRANIGGLTYIPTPNYGGPTDSFGWNASDGSDFADSATTYTFNITEVNDNPLPGLDNIDRYPTSSLKIPVATLLANDGDPSDSPPDLPLTIDSVNYTGGNGATVQLIGDTVFYNPNGWQGADTFTYVLRDSRGGTFPISPVNINIIDDNGPSLNLTKFDFDGGAGTLTITGAGIPGRVYRVQVADSGNPNAWTDYDTTIADPVTGVISYVDPAPIPGTRIYRTVHP